MSGNTELLAALRRLERYKNWPMCDVCKTYWAEITPAIEAVYSDINNNAKLEKLVQAMEPYVNHRIAQHEDVQQ